MIEHSDSSLSDATNESVCCGASAANESIHGYRSEHTTDVLEHPTSSVPLAIPEAVRCSTTTANASICGDRNEHTTLPISVSENVQSGVRRDVSSHSGSNLLTLDMVLWITAIISLQEQLLRDAHLVLLRGLIHALLYI